MRPSLLLVAILLSFSSTQAQIKATTEDGKAVMLRPDGTWGYISTEQSPASALTFRQTWWGMTKDQVKKSEGTEPVQVTDSYVAYEGDVAGMDCFIIYGFAQGKLVRSRYAFNEEHSNKNDYISDYSTIKEALTSKYGKPTNDDTRWRNDLYRDDRSEWGFAVSLGHLNYRADWKTDSTEITLALQGENYDIAFIAEYTSTELKHLEEADKKRKTQSEF